MQPFRILSTGSLCLVAVLTSGGWADGKKPSRTDAVIDGFVKSLESDRQLDADDRKAALDVVAKLRKSEDARDFAVTEALRQISPDFKKALAALGDEDLKTAVSAFRPLADAKNAFLAAESRYFLARAMMLQERYEDALPHLEKLAGPLSGKTLRAGEAAFLKGAAELYLLKRKEAAASLSLFLKKYPHASERLRVAAWRQLEILQTIRKGSLPDIHLHMQFVRRKLALQDSGGDTRKTQKKIVAMLDKLIEEAEKKGGS
ncbi:MAG: tol-pal system YbgF family protein [Planctomycetaceae bacterium]